MRYGPLGTPVDQQDNNNFLNTGVIFPITLAKIRVNGVEGRPVLPPIKGVSASVSVTHSRADLHAAIHGRALHRQQRDRRPLDGAVRHRSRSAAGRPRHRHLQRQERLLFDVFRALRLRPGVEPVRPRAGGARSGFLGPSALRESHRRHAARGRTTILDLSAGYEFMKDGKRRYDVSAQIANMTNRTALFNFQSVFVGTRVVAPITAGVRLRVYF
ncbi:MAG: hypothetical protein MZV70_29305 [Desulfobacterales bacterium]|nr:hypothetical protein [Desulfobacterales bacterium]